MVQRGLERTGGSENASGNKGSGKQGVRGDWGDMVNRGFRGIRVVQNIFGT